MKRIVAAALLLSLGGAQSASAQLALRGSDTLEKVTKQLLQNPTCNPGNAIEYAGGGSTNGETAMAAASPTQQIAPMSRPLNVCTGGTSTAENLAIGWDAIILGTSASCTGPGATWAQTLRTLYGGADGSGSATACGAADRTNLANNFNSTLGGCSTGGCNKIWHLFRRGDTSGTTDAFKTILEQAGAKVTSFCNGNETQDRDPIRRACRVEEEVCEGDGTLGLLLPIVVSTTEGVATATEDQLWYRGSAGNVNSVQKCKSGRFVKVNPSALGDSGCCIRAKAADTTSTCLAKPVAGKCLWPNSADLAGQVANSMCNNARTNDCFSANKPGTYTQVKDGRAFNLVVRGGAPNYTILKDSFSKEILTAFYRLRWTGKGQTHSCNTQVGYGTPCQELDSTREIGCLAKQAHPAQGTNTLDCDLGFAGDEARTVAGALAPNVNGQAPVSGSSINLNYPLKRKLYLSTIKGFENVTGAELALAKCFGTAATINPILQANGYSPLLDNGNDPKCEKASCTANNACSGNGTPFE